MAADETILEEEQEALSDDLQAELEDDMFFGEEDQPGEELTDSEDFLSEEELTPTNCLKMMSPEMLTWKTFSVRLMKPRVKKA